MPDAFNHETALLNPLEFLSNISHLATAMEVVNSFTLLTLVIGALAFFHQFFFSSFLLSSILDDPSTNNISELIGTHDLCENNQVERVNRDIFFLETSGEECLSVRQACSVESARRTNPDARILIRMEGNGPIPSEVYSKWKSERKGNPNNLYSFIS